MYIDFITEQILMHNGMDLVIKIQNETAWFRKKGVYLKSENCWMRTFPKGAYLVLKYPIVCQKNKTEDSSV